MPVLTGTESALSALLFSNIEAKLTGATGKPMLEPTYLKALCDAISESLIPHLVANIQVNPGQIVTGATGPTNIPTLPTPIPGTAATSTPGTIT